MALLLSEMNSLGGWQYRSRHASCTALAARGSRSREMVSRQRLHAGVPSGTCRAGVQVQIPRPVEREEALNLIPAAYALHLDAQVLGQQLPGGYMPTNPLQPAKGRRGSCMDDAHLPLGVASCRLHTRAAQQLQTFD